MTLIPGTTHTDTPGVRPKDWLKTLHVNAFNARLSDKSFREFVRKTLPLVDFERPPIDLVFFDSSLSLAKKVHQRLSKEHVEINFGLSVLDDKAVIWVRGDLLSPKFFEEVSDEACKYARSILRKKKRSK